MMTNINNTNGIEVINLTPHAVNFVADDGTPIITIEPCGTLARVSARTERTGVTIIGIPVTKTVYGDIEGLPEPRDGVVYVVSSIVASRCPERDDVFIPNESVRDESGRIIGCKSLGHI
jgi:hypothetical protein